MKYMLFQLKPAQGRNIFDKLEQLTKLKWLNITSRLID